MRCTMRRRRHFSSGFSSARAHSARAGLSRWRYFLRAPDIAPLYFGGFAGGEVAALLSIRDLRVYLDVDAGIVKAVDGVSFRVPERGTLALVGESGSGKSVVAQSIMGILPRIARIESGEILFRDPRISAGGPGSVVDLSRLHPLGPQMRELRGGRISIIFQEPILQLIRDLQRELGMAVLVITHDLGVVANMAAEVVVMYRGRVMEAGRIEDIFREPQHPYLRALMRAVPRFNMAPGERLTP